MPDYDPATREDDAIIEQAISIIARRKERELHATYDRLPTVTVTLESSDRLANFRITIPAGEMRERIIDYAITIHARERARTLGAQ